MNRLKKVFAIIMVIAMILSLSVTASADSAAEATIDFSKTGSLDIYKYDLSNAEKDGVWDSGYVSTGVKDTAGVENILGDPLRVSKDGAYGYAIKGVEFSFLKVADIATYTENSDGTEHAIMLYGITQSKTSDAFLAAIGLSQDDRYEKANVETDEYTIHYYSSDAIIDGLQSALEANSTTVKNALENYVRENGGTAMAETDEYGHTSVAELPIGLYLVVETKVPEMVTSTTSPFLVSIPMTSVDGVAWNYDITLYPKNLTGMPTLEKTVREAAADTGKSEEYKHTATASAGDVVEYQIISTLPTITSEASYLTEYSFKDTLAAGISYTISDVVLEFYSDTACTELVSTWDANSGKFEVSYSDNSMRITMTEAGLNEINTSDAVYTEDSMVNSGYSDCTLRITYSATLNSDSSLVLGDEGNSNEVVLTWQRSNTEYSDSLSDDCHVFTYGIDLTKQFSDGKGDFSKVEMLIHNYTDDYFLTAELKDGVYYVLDHAAEKADATRFVPTEDGKILIKGLEDDEYTVTEVKTDSAYTLLRDDINISITATEAAACEDCGEIMLTATSIIENKDSNMKVDNSSANALVTLTVINTRGFDLPQTGGYGTWMYPAAGVLAMGILVIMGFMMKKNAKETEEE